ncbi:MAG: chromosomal replication initiator protein DnaA [Planctomycetota bacterium]|nr:MAG: chromosomal replication initiator protein DnaA [Planctomycetota bacterium]
MPSASPQEVWRAALVKLRDARPELCRKWFEEIEPVALERGVLTLRLSDATRRRYVERALAEPFRAAAQEATGMLVSLRFVDDEPQRRNGAVQVRRDAVQRSLARPTLQDAAVASTAASEGSDPLEEEDLALNPDLTFETFVVGPNNRVAHAAAEAVAEAPGKGYNPLFLHGGVGLGKTHLLHALSRQALTLRPELRIVFVSCRTFIDRFFAYLSARRMQEFRRAFRRTDVLVIDDIHDLAPHNQIQEEFFHTFNTLRERGSQVVLSSDASPEEIPQLEERLVSRFAAGLVARLDPPDFDTRVAILQRKAELHDLDLPLDLAKRIASCYDDSVSVRVLEGAINRVKHLAHVTNDGVVTTEIVHEALGDLPEQAPTRCSIDAIVAAVVEHYNVSLAQLQGPGKTKSVVLPRQVAMWLAKERGGLSLEEIGGYFGGRDHTTALHAHRKISRLLHSDPALRGEIEALQLRIRRLSSPVR